MPRFVDHDQRRAEVVAAATELLLAKGRAALTVRNVAEAVGCSTKVVSHYFESMDELLHGTYVSAVERAQIRMTAVLAADPLDVQGLIESVLPLDEERRRDWTIWFGFWTEAFTSPALFAVQQSRARRTVERLSHIVLMLKDQKRLNADVDPLSTGQRLAALIPGIAGQAMFDLESWTPDRQRAVLCEELSLLGLKPR
jgi:AcrR family transcriptional regulator